MLNYLGNNLVPNGYIYKSHTGSKYVFLEGLWFSHSNMQMVDPRTYGNMYVSAQKQINEHNSTNRIKIGSTYIVEGQESVFIGNGKYFSNGKVIVERKQPKVTNYKPADRNSTEIPNGYMIDRDMYYQNGRWKMTGDNWEPSDPEQIARFNKMAEDQIKAANENSEIPFGSTIDINGNSYSWNGKNWYFSDSIWNPAKRETIDDKDEKIISQYLTDTDYGKNPEGAKKEQPKADEQPSQEEQPSQDQPEAAQEEQPKKLNPFDDPNTPRTELSGFDGEPVNKVNQDQGEVPDGFVYVSPQNKQYFKKKGVWYSSDTKKPVNASNVPLITRAAATQIKSLDRNSPVKIGQEWTSKAGKTYKYVGGDRFISDDGKMIPKGMAEKVKNDLAARKDDHEEENSEIKDKVDADIDNTSTATPEDRKEEEKVDQERAIDDHDAKQDDRVEGDDKLKGLADKIKSLDPSISRKITVLLTRADKLSLMAADILLSGDADKAKQILQTLNKRDK